MWKLCDRDLSDKQPCAGCKPPSYVLMYVTKRHIDGMHGFIARVVGEMSLVQSQNDANYSL